MWASRYWANRYWQNDYWVNGVVQDEATIPAIDFTLLAGVQTQEMLVSERRLGYFDYREWIEVEAGETLSDAYISVTPVLGLTLSDPAISGTKITVTLTGDTAGTYTLTFGADTSGGSVFRNRGTVVVS